MAFEHTVLVAAKVLVLALGLAIAALAFLAWRRNREPFALMLSLAFGLIALGSFAEGILFEFLAWNLFAVRIVEAVFVLAGLSMIAYLLRPRRSSA